MTASVFSGRAMRIAGRAILSPAAAMAASALFAFLAAVVVTFARGWPALPRVHDEWSYLLAADTFTRGRLSNPTPPFAEHFETFHVLMQPTYASKYPPAQGLFLALGKVLTGEPIVGVWISVALLAAAVLWMLLGWFRLKWALVGTLLVTLMLAAGTNMGYWMSTYWGGALTASGAALLYGSVRRLTRTPRPRYGVTFALGLALLGLTRPFEGALVAIPAVVVAARWLLMDRRTALSWRLGRVVAPFGVVVAAVATFFFTYNARVTGNPWRMPYMEHEAQYSDVPIWAFEKRDTTRLVNRPNEEFRRYYAAYRDTSLWRSPTALAKGELERLAEIKRFLAPGLTLILVLVAATSGLLRWLRLPLFGSAIVVLGSLLTSWFFPHYIAPMLAPWAIVLTAGARTLWLMPGSRRTGPMLVVLVFAITIASAIMAPIRLVAERKVDRPRWDVTHDSLTRALAADGRRHIVLVRYGPEHNFDEEWVYNSASIEQQPVIWARSLAPEKDARLISYFGDRVVWYVDVDVGGVPFRIVDGDVPAYQIAKRRGDPDRLTLQASNGVVELPAAAQGAPAPNGH